MITIDRSARWFRWLLKPVLILLSAVVLFTVASYLGGLLFQSHEEIAAFDRAADDLFWGFLAFRFILYALIFWKAEALFRLILNTQSADDLSADVVHFRKIQVRLVVIYELLFPFDLIGRFSTGGF